MDIADPDERPGLDLRAASASGNMPQPRPARTAAANPSEVGTKWVGRAISRRKTLRTNMSCKASARFQASDGDAAAARAVNPSGPATARGRPCSPPAHTASGPAAHPAPGIGPRSVVTAPITVPSRSSRAEWSWSSIRMSNSTSGQSREHRGEPGRHRVGVHRDGDPYPRDRSRHPCRPAPRPPARRSARPAAAAAPRPVSGTRLLAHHQHRPTRCSSDLIRWLIADGVTCRRSAAASKLPSSITAAKAASCSPSSATLAILMQIKNY